MNNRYDILEFVSQGENGTLSPENEKLVHIANVIRRASADSDGNESKTQCSTGDVGSLNKRYLCY